MKALLTLLLFFIAGYIPAFSQTKFAVVNIRMISLQDGDTVKLTMNTLGSTYFENDITLAAPLINHSCSFKITIGNAPLHLSIAYAEKVTVYKHFNMLNTLALNGYYLQAGDNISILEQDGGYQFCGKNASQFLLVYVLNSIHRKFNSGMIWDNPLNTKPYFLKADSAFIEKMSLLETNRDSLSADIYTLLKADAIGDYLTRYNFVNTMPSTFLKLALENLDDYRSSVPDKYLDTANFDKNNILRFANNYAYGLLVKYQYDSCTVAKRPFTLQNSYKFICQHFLMSLRERLLTDDIYLHRDKAENIAPYLNDAIKLISSPDLRTVLSDLKLTRSPGAEAFNFILTDTSGKVRAFSEFKGKAVVMDFWFTGCGGCRIAASYLEKIEEHFQGQPVVFLTISIDSKRETWLNTVRTKTYTSKYSVDLYTNGQALNNPVAQYYQVFGCPTIIVIGKNGKQTQNPGNPADDRGASLMALIGQEINK